METPYKSATAMSSQPWVEHFKHTAGKSEPWTNKSKLVLLKRNTLGGKPVNTKSMPLNVVSPTEQFAEMAQASIDKNTPKYKSPSVAAHTSKGRGGRRSKRSKRSGKNNNKKAKKKRTKSGTVKSKKVSRGKSRKRSKGGRRSRSKGGPDIFS